MDCGDIGDRDYRGLRVFRAVLAEIERQFGRPAIFLISSLHSNGQCGYNGDIYGQGFPGSSQRDW